MKLLADPEIQAILAKDNFTAIDTVTLVLDFNDASSDYRRIVAVDWCERYVTGRWRRRVQERRGMALLDQVRFEFETLSDARKFRDFTASQGW